MRPVIASATPILTTQLLNCLLFLWRISNASMGQIPIAFKSSFIHTHLFLYILQGWGGIWHTMHGTLFSVPAQEETVSSCSGFTGTWSLLCLAAVTILSYHSWVPILLLVLSHLMPWGPQPFSHPNPLFLLILHSGTPVLVRLYDTEESSHFINDGWLITCLMPGILHTTFWIPTRQPVSLMKTESPVSNYLRSHGHQLVSRD